MAILCSFSKIGKGELEEVQSLEKELGISLLAFSCPEMKFAKLSEEQLKKVEELEKKLGVVLISVE